MDIKKTTLNFQHWIECSNPKGKLVDQYEHHDVRKYLRNIGIEAHDMGFEVTPVVETGLKNILMDAAMNYKFGPVSDKQRLGFASMNLWIAIMVAVVDNGNSLAISVEFSLSPDMDRDTIIKDSKKTYGRVVTRLGSVRRLSDYSQTVSAFSQNF